MAGVFGTGSFGGASRCQSLAPRRKTGEWDGGGEGLSTTTTSGCGDEVERGERTRRRRGLEKERGEEVEVVEEGWI